MQHRRQTSQPKPQAYWSLHKSIDHIERANGEVEHTDRAISKDAQLGNELYSTVSSFLLQTVHEWTQWIGNILFFHAFFAVGCCFLRSVSWNKQKVKLLSFLKNEQRTCTLWLIVHT